MKYYGLSQQRIKRVIKSPERIEEGIAEKTIACMQNAGSSKHPYEIWVMYQLRKGEAISNFSRHSGTPPRRWQFPISKKLDKSNLKFKSAGNAKIKIISAWRYPGKSPKNNPIPEEILNEIKSLI
jgi:hypothetical protein